MGISVRIIKLALLSFLFLFLVITAISLFIPSHVRISKAINIMSLPDSVMKPIKDLRRWNLWYPSLKKIQPGEIEYSDSTAGITHSMKVSGISISLDTTKSNQVIASFQSPGKKPVINGWQTITYAQTDTVTLQWYMDFQLGWLPWEKFSSLLFEKMYGSQMELGLTNLKHLVESGRLSNN